MSLQKIKNDPEMREYFQRLPMMVQESIAQSGKTFADINHLKQMVQQLERFQNDGKKQ